MHSLDDTRARCIIPLPDPVSRLYTICGASVAYYNVTCPYSECQCAIAARQYVAEAEVDERVPGRRGRDQKCLNGA